MGSIVDPRAHQVGLGKDHFDQSRQVIDIGGIVVPIVDDFLPRKTFMASSTFTSSKVLFKVLVGGAVIVPNRLPSHVACCIEAFHIHHIQPVVGLKEKENEPFGATLTAFPLIVSSETPLTASRMVPSTCTNESPVRVRPRVG